ncbi:hypothetical protein JW960_06515 [candidate division KSB1 bacterium]|nr:hypothetical protein [candidate division KSB1 bacterium]
MLNFQHPQFSPLKKWIPSFIILPFAIYYLTHRGSYTLLDNADLIIHESGHFFFMLFGDFIQFAGGTLMQIIFPTVLAIYFLFHLYKTGFQVMTFWLGHHLINISVYAADAQARKLHLLGGGIHDWHWMLSRLGMLDACGAIGNFFFISAILMMLISLLFPLVWEDWE